MRNGQLVQGMSRLIACFNITYVQYYMWYMWNSIKCIVWYVAIYAQNNQNKVAYKVL